MNAERLTAEACMEQSAMSTGNINAAAMWAQRATAEALIDLTYQVAQLAHALDRIAAGR